MTVKKIVTKLPSIPEMGDRYILNIQNVDSAVVDAPIAHYDGKWNYSFPKEGDYAWVADTTEPKSLTVYRYSKSEGWVLQMQCSTI